MTIDNVTVVTSRNERGEMVITASMPLPPELEQYSDEVIEETVKACFVAELAGHAKMMAETDTR